MYADDRVLVGVINRQRDLKTLVQEGWYRIPFEQFPHGIYEEYLAFYLSGSASKPYRTSGIHFYAQRGGVELAYRLDLLPDEPQHPHATAMYYRIQCRALQMLRPPIVNQYGRRIAFIMTTWDRFSQAVEIGELYSQAPHYVKRLGQ
jgi:hypothetical protein